MSLMRHKTKKILPAAGRQKNKKLLQPRAVGQREKTCSLLLLNENKKLAKSWEAHLEHKSLYRGRW